MSFSLTASGTVAQGTGTSRSQSFTVASGVRLLLVEIGVRSAATFSAVQYGGVSMSLAGSYLDATLNERISLYYLVDPTVGTANVTYTVSAGDTNCAVISSWTVSGTPSVDVTATGGPGSGANVSATLSGATGTLMIACCIGEDNANPGLTKDADETAIAGVWSGSWGIAGSYELSPASNETSTWTKNGGGDDAGLLLVTFIEGSSGTAIGRATETNTARALAANQSKALGRAAETNTARALTRSIAQALGRATELDSARALAAGQSRALGRAVETDTARPLSTGATLLDIGRALEIDLARPLTWSPQLVAVGRASETDTARPLTPFVAGNVDVLLSDRRRRHRAAGLP